MIGNHIQPDEITFTNILTAISSLGPSELEKVVQIHQQITQRKFDSNVILINSLIKTYTKCGELSKSIKLYNHMIGNNITRDKTTLITILATISSLGPGALEKGKKIHQHITKHKLDTNRAVINSLIQMYNNCGEPNKSIELYDRMIENNIKPNKMNFASILSIISNLGPSALEKGKQIHQQITHR
eukprot:TRINITY_DN4377_c0_g1_i1.p1 TRINITY_DN4377_c0_g1~~TRINITY_DN4377_c0_g1_i1.p1  ORF type:complete len:186 (-),score=42.68 TRINITY_DN4377_c0_g1_i1:55-612(-)